jgi:hypothetical protein
VAYANLWDLQIDPATALISAFYQAIEPKGMSKVLARLNPIINKVKLSGKIADVAEGGIEADLKENKKSPVRY